MPVSQDLHIRSADYSDASDAADIIHLMQAYAQDPMGGGELLSADVVRNLVSNLAQIPGAFSLLAFAGGEAVGLVTCFEGFSTFKCKPLINIHDVIVLPSCRGNGIVGRMLQQVEQIARERGCCKLTLEVLEGNKAARHAYGKAGFTDYMLLPETGRAIFQHKLIG
ncbi:MAG: GNAT family N-acetyltransferase [Gammaproteobacteria bacterium]|jgi:ribosomal protein S18 acetylase RimI-like enzyme